MSSCWCLACKQNFSKTPQWMASLAKLNALLPGPNPEISLTCIVCQTSMINDVICERNLREGGTETAAKPELTPNYLTIVKEDTGEYKRVADRFRASLAGAVILRIEKNHNGTLYKKHQAFPEPRELLFHGSRHINYDNILHNGFDLGRSNDGLYGRGIYFARDSSLSHGYTHGVRVTGQNNATIYNMLVCEVSIKDYRGDNGIYCVPQQDQGYPMYVVYYQLG